MVFPRPLRAAVAWCSRTRLFRRIGPTVMPPLERFTKRITRGRGGPLSSVVVPSLVLHTTGAKTGRPRTTQLMCCPADDGILVAGSNFGRPDHPAWTANLLAHPDAEIVFRGERRPVRATLIGADEREAVWRTLEQQWPSYRDYERSAGRELRIFRLTPR